MSQQYKKVCTNKTCSKEIQMSNHTGKWLPYNLDNSPHRCLPVSNNSTKPAAEIKPEVKSLTLEQIDARLKRVESLLFNEGK